jgi:hypothetical protein
MDLRYEQAEPYPLLRQDVDPQAARRAIVSHLIARKESGVIKVGTLNSRCDAM